MTLDEIIEKLTAKKIYYEKIEFPIIANEIAEIIDSLNKIKNSKSDLDDWEDGIK